MAQIKKIIDKRKKVYNAAKKLHPERWSRNTRSWEIEETVALNPSDKNKAEQISESTM